MIIYGITLRPNRRLFFELQRVTGIGRTRAEEIIKHFNLNKQNAKVIESENLTLSIVKHIEETYKDVPTGVKEIRLRNIKKLIAMQCLRGVRHVKKLPQKGRTRTNSRTARKGII